MPDQTKTRGLQLALNSLESAYMILKAIGGSDALKWARALISVTKDQVQSEIDQNEQNPRPYVGEERREKE